jgi:hypothetical protein
MTMERRDHAATSSTYLFSVYSYHGLAGVTPETISTKFYSEEGLLFCGNEKKSYFV